MDNEKKVENNAPKNEQESGQLSKGEESKDKKMKNLVSAVILISGLFVGSLFVDVIQMFRGGGFSQKALDSADVFASAGKTWVAYGEPVVKIQVITDDACEQCKPDEVLIGLKQVIPTLLNEKIDVNSAEGKAIAERNGIKTIPAFVFSKDIEKIEFFSKAEPFMEKKGDWYVLKSAEAGFPVGKYIELPKVGENDIKIGSDDAKIKVVEFTDFQCPYCKKLHEEVVSKVLKDYGEKIQLVFKNFPLESHALAAPAAIAGECANEQGKFESYADKLFASQESWGKMKDASATFKGYARSLGLNAADFNKCFDEKKYEEKVKASLEEGKNFGIQGTPALFIGDNFQNGLVKYEDVKKILDEQLAK